MIHFFLILLLTLGVSNLGVSNVQAEKQTKDEIINKITHLDVFLIDTVKKISKTKKQYAEFKVLNYAINRCVLEGQIWQEHTKAFKALLVETQYLRCGKKKYPAPFYSRIIEDERLFLDSQSHFGSFAKVGLEIFLIRN